MKNNIDCLEELDHLARHGGAVLQKSDSAEAHSYFNQWIKWVDEYLIKYASGTGLLAEWNAFDPSPLKKGNDYLDNANTWHHFRKRVKERLIWLSKLSAKLSIIHSSQKKEVSNDFEENISKKHKVFVVHGRNIEARNAIFSFLRVLGLKPIEWNQAVNLAGKPAPFIGEILEAAFSEAQAVVVLLTGDDEARLNKMFLSDNDQEYEKQLTAQARPNVLFEAGMAFGSHSNRTILIQIGKLRPFSDIAGRHVIKMDNTSEKRQELARRLELAGCPVNLSGTDWHKEGDFEKAIPNYELTHSVEKELNEHNENLIKENIENRVDTGTERILKLISSPKKSSTFRFLQSELNLPVIKIECHLEMLLEKDFIGKVIIKGTEVFQVTKKGRAYLANIDAAGVPSVFAHPYGFSKALWISPPNARAMKQFSILARAMFLGIVELIPYELSIGNKLTQDLQSFESNLDRMFNIQWQKKTIGGVYPNCFCFPDARFMRASEYESENQPAGDHPDEEYSGITLDSLEEAVKDRTRVYGGDLIKALFKRWIQEIIQELGRPVNQQDWSIWLQRLQDISNGEWSINLDAPDGSLKEFTETTHEFQLRQLKSIKTVTIRSISKHIFCEKVVEFETGEKPDIPVKSQYLSLLDIDNTGYTGNNYSIKLKDWEDAFDWNPAEFITGSQNQPLKASILYWPDFKADDWNVNYLFFAPSPVFSAYRPHLNLLSENYAVLDNIAAMTGCWTDRPVKFIEVLLNTEPRGIFRDNRKKIESGGMAVTLSIDFGTTHTSLGTKDSNTGQYQLFEFENITHDRLAMRYFKDSTDDEIQFVRKSCFWFPPASFQGGLTVLPSELVFKSPGLLPKGDPVLKYPIENYMIPHPRIDRDLLHEIAVENFKWIDRPPFTQDALTKSYLKIVLHMALGVLRKRDLCRNVALVPTYPLAFGRERHRLYKQLLLGANDEEGLFSEIENETGVKLSLAIVNSGRGLQEFVAESHAAKEFCATADGKSEMVVDIGGGTTDIALWTNGNSFVDSFQYGANRYLNYLANKFQTYPPQIKNPKERMIALQKIVRQNGIREVLKIYPAAHKSTAQQAIDRFFQGLFEYIRRMLNAAEIEQAHIYPVGNGWRLIEGYVPPNDNIRDYINNWFGQAGISLHIITPSDSDYKGLVAKGARRIADVQQYDHPDLNTPARTILGGVISVNGETIEAHESVPTGPLGTPPLRFSTAEFIQSLPFQPTQSTDLEVISGRFAKYCQNAVYPCPGGSYGLNKSIFAIFLETIYPDNYL